MISKQLPAVLTGLVLLGVAAALTALPEGSGEEAVTRHHPRRAVQVAPVEIAAGERDLRLPGVTRASRRASLAFTVAGRVAARPVEVGDGVVAGEAVAALDDREYRLAEEAATAALEEVDARLGQLRRDLTRAERLLAARAATAEEVEQVRSATAALEAGRLAASSRRDEARRLRDEALLRAPFDATVTDVQVEPGEWAAPGRAVVELAGRGAVEVAVEVPEGLRHRVTQGSRVEVSLPFLAREVKGEVTRVADAAGGAGGLFPVEVSLEPAAWLVSGLAAEVVLTLEAAPELTVPLSAVVDPGGGRPAVFRIVDGQAERVEVRPGHVVGDRLTVEGSLAAGDRVAVAGHTALADGDPVEVL